MFGKQKLEKTSYGIVGLGRFGTALACELAKTDAEILALDRDEEKVREMREVTEHRTWLKAEYDWLKAADPSRLVVDNSPCNGNFHVKTDLNDFHYYRSVPERRAMERRLLEFLMTASRTGRTSEIRPSELADRPRGGGCLKAVLWLMFLAFTVFVLGPLLLGGIIFRLI